MNNCFILYSHKVFSGLPRHNATYINDKTEKGALKQLKFIVSEAQLEYIHIQLNIN